MDIGVPKEAKVMEGRVGLIPEACKELLSNGHKIFIETSAGELSGYSDEDYIKAGCIIVDNAEALYGQSKLIVKVKEPVTQDLQFIQSHHIIFSFLHLAANKQLVDQLCEIGCQAIAFESVVNAKGKRFILSPMSQIAGKLSVQIGAHLLHQPMGGSGLMLGGIEGTERGEVVVLGAGVAGKEAALLADKLGANVTVFDIDMAKLEHIRHLAGNIKVEKAELSAIEPALKKADLVVGAVLLPDKHTPRVVTEEMVINMKKGAVIVDIAIDQGGCVETIRPTNYASPTFIAHDVIHFGVTNMPGAVPRTASQALSAVILSPVSEIASMNTAVVESIKNAINIESGKIIHPVLIEEFKSAK